MKKTLKTLLYQKNSSILVFQENRDNVNTTKKMRKLINSQNIQKCCEEFFSYGEEKKNDLLEFIKKEDSKKDSIGILLISHQNETRQSNSNTAT